MRYLLLELGCLNDSVDQRLWSIKHVQNKYFEGIDVVVCGDFD